MQHYITYIANLFITFKFFITLRILFTYIVTMDVILKCIHIILNITLFNYHCFWYVKFIF